ncbi:MAG: DUF3291 domain-containing protein [Yoonia sp.]|nr:DUF3291 domain-containing protein [Yoonia sp.]
MADYHLAELNIGRLRADKDDPSVADFMNNLDRINGLGKRMPGFVWIMEGETGEGNTATMIDGDPRYIPNLTVWENAQALETFVFKTLHTKFMDRRAEWFEALGQMHFVMWWVSAGHKPTLAEALARLEILRRDGDCSDAFGWDYMRKNPSPPRA